MSVSLKVAEAESDILAAEGQHYVAGCYFADAETASKARRIEAERRVREATRMESLRELLATRWEITNEGLWALAETIHGEPAMPCLIGHDGVCRTHDECCARNRDGSWVCYRAQVA